MNTKKIVKFLLLLFLNSISLLLFGQSPEQPKFRLAAEKDGLTGKNVIFFKPDKRLVVKTIQGQRIVAVKFYEIHENCIVMNMNDTVQLEKLDWVKGRVQGDIGRKALGVGFIGAGLMTMFVGGLYAGFEEASLVASLLPGVAMTAGGIIYVGSRKFSRQNSWLFKTVL